MKHVLVLAMALIAGDASAAAFKVTAQLPVRLKLKSAKTIDQGGSKFTVVEIEVRNGSVSTMKLGLHCDAEMKGGFTWNITGQATHFDKDETRIVRIVADADEYSSNPTKLDCFVSSYEGFYP